MASKNRKLDVHRRMVWPSTHLGTLHVNINPAIGSNKSGGDNKAPEHYKQHTVNPRQQDG